MRYDEWQALGLPMNWSIYPKDYEDRDEDIGKWPLDLTAPVEDGVYDLTIRPSSNDNSDPVDRKMYDDAIPRIGGVVVKDGKFDPFSTAYAAYVVERMFYEQWAGRYNTMPFGEKMDHCYIESLEWDKQNNCFYLGVGS